MSCAPAASNLCNSSACSRRGQGHTPIWSIEGASMATTTTLPLAARDRCVNRTISQSTSAPDDNLIAVKLAASMLSPLRAARQSSEFPAKAIIAKVIPQIPVEPNWPCHSALANAIMTARAVWPKKTIAELKPILVKYL
jgi:hypothetical protein